MISRSGNRFMLFFSLLRKHLADLPAGHCFEQKALMDSIRASPEEVCPELAALIPEHDEFDRSLLDKGMQHLWDFLAHARFIARPGKGEYEITVYTHKLLRLSDNQIRFLRSKWTALSKKSLSRSRFENETWKRALAHVGLSWEEMSRLPAPARNDTHRRSQLDQTASDLRNENAPSEQENPLGRSKSIYPQFTDFCIKMDELKQEFGDNLDRFLEIWREMKNKGF